jgi:hypothetical protein
MIGLQVVGHHKINRPLARNRKSAGRTDQAGDHEAYLFHDPRRRSGVNAIMRLASTIQLFIANEVSSCDLASIGVDYDDDLGTREVGRRHLFTTSMKLKSLLIYFGRSKQVQEEQYVPTTFTTSTAFTAFTTSAVSQNMNRASDFQLQMTTTTSARQGTPIMKQV